MGDMGKPTFQTCFLTQILGNSHEKAKEYYSNERLRKLEILNMENAEKAIICK
jgi:ATP-dependent protease HslVU (ClpYQ) peptidase subunit